MNLISTLIGTALVTASLIGCGQRNDAPATTSAPAPATAPATAASAAGPINDPSDMKPHPSAPEPTTAAPAPGSGEGATASTEPGKAAK